MIPYLICFTLPSLVLLLPKNTIKDKRTFIALLLLPAAFLIAFKGRTIGADTPTYNNIFRDIYNGNFWQYASNERLERGYVWLIWFLSRFTSSPQSQYIVLGAFFFATFFYLLYKNTEEYTVFLLLFYGLNVFSFFLTGVRQSYALLICFWGYDQARKKHLIRFLLCVGLAFLFHKSAIAFIIVYFSVNKKFKKTDITFYFIVFALVAVFNEYIFYIGGELFDLDYGIEYVANGYIMFAIIAFITALSFIFYKKLIASSRLNAGLIGLNAMCMAFWILRLFSRTAERVSLYYMPFTILIVCQLLKLVKDETNRIIISFGIIAVMGVLFIYRLNTLALLPYVFYWN